MLLSIPARNNGQKPHFTWYEMDTLRGGDDTIEEFEFIAVTESAPGSTIRAAYNFARPRKSVQRLIDDGYLTFVRHEIYPRGASCDVYKLSASGKAAVENFYSECHEESRARDEAFNAKQKAEQKELNRLALTAALEEQFKGNYYIPALEEAISASQTPFLDVPMPEFAPHGRDGLAVTIREYLLALWFQVLPDDLYKTLSSVLIWTDTIGFDDALAMFTDQDDETDGDLGSPTGRIS